MCPDKTAIDNHIQLVTSDIMELYAILQSYLNRLISHTRLMLRPCEKYVNFIQFEQKKYIGNHT